MKICECRDTLRRGTKVLVCCDLPRLRLSEWVNHGICIEFSADEECWGNVSLLPESQARACGFSTEATFCKSTTSTTKKNNDEDCCGNLVSYPRRLFPVFDCYKNPNTGTFICEAH